MKNLYICLLSALILFAACGTLGGSKAASAPTSAAFQTGQSFGRAIKQMFSNYKNTGKINFGNPATLLSIANLAGNYSSIKSQLSDKSFYAEFIAGIIAGSREAVNKSSASSVLSLFNKLDLSKFIATKSGEVELSEAEKSELNDTFEGIFALME